MKVNIRQKANSENSASVYLDIYFHGQRKKEYLKKHVFIKARTANEKRHNKEVLSFAERVRAKRITEMENGLYGFGKGEQRNVNFINYFDSLVKARAKTGVNYETWKHVLGHLKKFAGTFVTFADINDQWLENVKSYFLRNVSQNSAHTYFNKVKAAIHQAQRDGIIINNPAIRVKSPKQVDTKREFLTLEELQAVAAKECHYPILKRAFLFSALTGLRWSDINRLKWEEVQYANHHGWCIRFTQQKTLQAETLPIPEQARDLLGEAGPSEERVFKGLKYSAEANIALLQWMMKAGISKHITFHCARHTYATLQLTLGTDIYTVSKLLGHRELRTTQIYAKVIDQKKVEAVEKIPSIGVI